MLRDGTGTSAPLVLPLVPAVPPPPSATFARRPAPTHVYSRRRRGSATAAPTPPSPPRPLDAVLKPVDKLLPVPRKRGGRRGRDVPPPGALPRRSRRIAGAKPVSPGPVINQYQRRVMQSLGFGGSEKLDVKAQDNYSKLFESILSDAHLTALTALFGWAAEDVGQVRSAEMLGGQ